MNYLSNKKMFLKNIEVKDEEGTNKIFPNDFKAKDKLENEIKEEINKEFFQILRKDKMTDEDSKLVRKFVENYIKTNKYFFQDFEDYKIFVDMIINDIFGLGVLENYLNNPDIQEIWVLGKDNIFYEEKGIRKKSTLRFKNDKIIVSMINKILAPINRKADESTPKVDGTLPDGSRVAITMPPVALDGPQIVIRKFKKEKFTIWEYIKYGSATMNMAKFLSKSVEWGANILVVGGTGSGKTTLLNALGNEIPHDRGEEHIITIEDSAELIVHSPFLQRWETKNNNSEGRGEVNASELVKHSLRNSPDRIWLGETRDKVAYDVLQAAITGHKGTMTTIHADNAARAVDRFNTLASSSGIISVEDSKRLFSEAFDLIVVMEKVITPKGEIKRVISQITHVVGVGKLGAEKSGVKNTAKIDEDRVYLQDVYKYNTKTGNFITTGYIPKTMIDKAIMERREYDMSIFNKEEA